MSHELMITSAPRGLQPGSMGFCTVAMTPHLPSVLQQRLETLSSYRHVYPPMDARAKNNPVCFQHLRLQVGGKSYSVLSRIGDTGLDYTERSNKFGHHLALSPAERSSEGPAATMLHPKTFLTAWKGEPRELEPQRSLAAASIPPGVARQWKAATGDSGWAGVLAEMYLENQKDPIYVEYPAGTEVLPLFAEAVVLLPEEERWEVTFSTYFQGLPPELTCHWRGVVKDSPEAKQARSRNARIIPIQPGSSAPHGGTLAAWARTGAKPAVSEITPFLEDSDLTPLGFKSERKGSRPASGQPFELKRSNQAKASFQSKSPVSQGRSFSVMSLLLGLLLGFLLSVLVGLGLWFANRTDPSLEVARDQKLQNDEAKTKELQKELDDEKAKRAVLDKAMSTAQSNLEGQEKKAKQLETEVKGLSDKVVKFTEENKKLKDESSIALAKINELVAQAQAKDEASKTAIKPSSKEAVYYDFSKVEASTPIVLADPVFDASEWKSIKLLRSPDFLIELKDKKTENGIMFYKETTAAGASDQNIFEITGIGTNKLTASFYVDQKDETLQLLKNSIIELETTKNGSFYLTAIHPVVITGTIPYVIDKIKNESEYPSYKNPKPPFSKIHHIAILPGQQRSSVVSCLSSLLKTKGNEMRIDISTDVSDNDYYYNSVTVKPSDQKLTLYDPIVAIEIKYHGRKSSMKFETDELEAQYNKMVDASKLDKVTIKALALTLKMHGVDVLIWRMAQKPNVFAPGAANPGAPNPGIRPVTRTIDGAK